MDKKNLAALQHTLLAYIQGWGITIYGDIVPRIGKVCENCQYWVPNKAQQLSERYTGEVCLEQVTKGYIHRLVKSKRCDMFLSLATE